MQFAIAHQTAILGFLLALSELLGLIPGVKANSIFQLIVGLITKQKASAPASE